MKFTTGALLLACGLAATTNTANAAASTAEYTVATREGELTTLIYQTIATTDASLIGGASVAIDQDGIRWPSTQAFGRGMRDGSRMGIEACTNMNTMYELLVSSAFVKLFQDTQFTTSIDDPISPTLSPNGITLTNPRHNARLTYRQLMQHTSTLLDNGFAAYAQTTPATVTTLDAFVEAYLTTGAGGVLQTNAFSQNEPGSTTSYSFARINTALLAYVINRLIADQGLAYRNVADYIAQNFIQPMGLSHTFFLQPDGSPARVSTMYDFSGTFPGVTSTDTAIYTAYYQQCIVDQDASGSYLIHPAFVSDYMAYTSTADVARLVNHLFMSNNLRWTTISNELRSVFLVGSTTGRVASQTGTGLGLMYFDGLTICSTATFNNILSRCPMANTSGIYGYYTSRDKVQTGFMCADATSIGPLCVVTTLLYSSSSIRDTTVFDTITAATFQDLVGDTYSSGANGASLASGLVQPPEKDEWFGVYVFVGVYSTIAFVYIVTKLIIYWGLQISVAANTNTGGAAQLATPKRQTILD